MKIFSIVIFTASMVLFFYSCNKKQENEQRLSESLIKRFQNQQTIASDSSWKDFTCYDGTFREQNLCADAEYKYFDSIVQQMFDSLITIIDQRLLEEETLRKEIDFVNTDTLKTKIILAQKQWETLRDANAAIEKLRYETGTVVGMMMNFQMIADTKQRIRFLQYQINAEIY